MYLLKSGILFLLMHDKKRFNRLLDVLFMVTHSIPCIVCSLDISADTTDAVS